jgi:hypothetical protein
MISLVRDSAASSSDSPGSPARSMVTESGPRMEGNGLEPEQFFERGGQEMLSVVLLHVIETARPVDLAVHHVVIEPRHRARAIRCRRRRTGHR